MILCSSSETFSLAEHGEKQWKQFTEVQRTQISTNRKNVLRVYVIGRRCSVLQVFVLFVLRPKIEQSSDRGDSE